MDRMAMQKVNRALRGAMTALDSGEIYAAIAQRAWRDARIGMFGGSALEGPMLQVYTEAYHKADAKLAHEVR